jgi:hypothetical protein
MPSSVTNGATPLSGCLRHCALAIGQAPGLPGEHGLAAATLVSWLIAEVLGAYMLTAWIGSGGASIAKDAPGAVPRPLIFGHAGLAFTGLACWIAFVATGQVILAWLAIAFLAPAIGLGISTVTLWTPYPVRRPVTEPDLLRFDGMLGITTDEMLARALEDEALTTRLVDDLVASVLASPRPALRRPKLRFSPLIPAIHGLLAMSTVALAVLSAVSAS